ncbi:MAG: nucleoside phosphorylase [Elusimicrobia bacterium]|nr:nucleoside phosphorylase [Elusimicrobiota bacterium]
MKQEKPIIENKYYKEPSVFLPDNLLKQSIRQKSLIPKKVPAVCVLDPDGDIAEYLLRKGQAKKNIFWPCYHTDMYVFKNKDREIGIVPGAVGSSFAVLVAEELFSMGCKLLISITSAGQIYPVMPPPYFVLIEKAIRDEGTSYHYLPPSKFAYMDKTLLKLFSGIIKDKTIPLKRGVTWTTDAPFRETASCIKQFKLQKILAVEMEAAALYAFSKVKKKPLICFAYVTNQMGKKTKDFEKGEHNGSELAIHLINSVAGIWDSVITER